MGNFADSKSGTARQRAVVRAAIVQSVAVARPKSHQTWRRLNGISGVGLSEKAWVQAQREQRQSSLDVSFRFHSFRLW
ncbi:MAG: hypothetical protein NTW21_44585 [Verrucomicrobia bacterium]|nr:hypothetical protein [Verrucomicrobiota bacterium]